MPVDADWRDYFGVDKYASLDVDISPRYTHKVIEETDRYIISTSPWDVTKKDFKALDSTPEYLDFTVTTPEAWEAAKARMVPSPDRVNWKWLKEQYPLWQQQGQWVQCVF